MMGQQTSDIERKSIAILRVLSDSSQPLGGRILARRLADLGIDLGERAVRYHLKLMDGRGLTRSVGRRDGRLITDLGIEELGSALLSNRVGMVNTKINMLAYQSCFDLDKRAGQVPINVSLFSEEEFSQAVEVVEDVFHTGFGIGDFFASAFAGDKLGCVVIPPGKVGLATLSHIVIFGILLRAGIPVYSRFGGILQIRNQEALRFVQLIEYAGYSLDPSEIFSASKMTSVSRAVKEGSGKVLANFCEVQAIARSDTEAILKNLEAMGIKGLILLGKTCEPVCQFPVTADRFGMVLTDGLNPVAAAIEAGIKVVNYAMSGLIDFGKFRHFNDCRSIGERPCYVC